MIRIVKGSGKDRYVEELADGKALHVQRRQIKVTLGLLATK